MLRHPVADLRGLLAPGRLQQQLTRDHQRDDADRDRHAAQEHGTLEVAIGPQIALELPARQATSPIAPVFSVFSHTISLPWISLRYAVAVIAHSSGP